MLGRYEKQLCSVLSLLAKAPLFGHAVATTLNFAKEEVLTARKGVSQEHYSVKSRLEVHVDGEGTVPLVYQPHAQQCAPAYFAFLSTLQLPTPFALPVFHEGTVCGHIVPDYTHGGKFIILPLEYFGQDDLPASLASEARTLTARL